MMNDVENLFLVCPGHMRMTYLDYNATTPVDPIVVDSMMPFFTDTFGNPSSTHHDSGRTASHAVEEARKQVADSVGMNPSDVIFTSGATEANNLALAGLRMGIGRPINILAGATEHKSVLNTCRACDGSTFRIIPVLEDGTLDLLALEDMLQDSIDVVSVMAANSETGVVHPIMRISEIVHKHGALFHCDATQAVGKISFNASEYNIDMVTLSSHKIYGPKGCGALVASRDARKRLAGVIHGGGQEREMRSGTLNVPAIVGFGMACRIATTKGLMDAPRQQHIRDSFEKNLINAIPDVSINGRTAERIPNTSNFRIHGALADAVLTRTKHIEASTGSACSSSVMEPSHVLVAMGLDRTAADESMRVSVGRQTKISDVELAVSDLAQAVGSIKKLETMHGGST